MAENPTDIAELARQLVDDWVAVKHLATQPLSHNFMSAGLSLFPSAREHLEGTPLSPKQEAALRTVAPMLRKIRTKMEELLQILEHQAKR